MFTFSKSASFRKLSMAHRKRAELYFFILTNCIYIIKILTSCNLIWICFITVTKESEINPVLQTPILYQSDNCFEKLNFYGIGLH